MQDFFPVLPHAIGTLVSRLRFCTDAYYYPVEETDLVSRCSLLTISAQVIADAPPFTDDEIVIYRESLLHYHPGPCEGPLCVCAATVRASG
jgi:hypothetical protein